MIRRAGIVALLTALCAGLLSGCQGAFDRAAPPAELACVAADQPLQATLLSQYRSGMAQDDPTQMPSAAAAAPQWLSLVRPAQVAASGNDVFIADGGLGAVVRSDRFGQSFSRVARLPGARIGGLATDRFGTLFLAVPAERAILQIGRNGLADRAIGHDGVLGAPVDVAVDDNGNLFVADELGARVVAFDRLGQVTAVVGERGGSANPFRSVNAVALGPEGVYVLDTTARQIVIVAPRGPMLRALPLSREVAHPVAIAVDRWGRIFVAGRGAGIFVMEPDTPTAMALGGVPSAVDIADLHLDEQGILYVADGAGGVVSAVQVPPRCR